MTPTAKAKLRIKKQAQRERLKQRIAARKAKRAVKVAPRKALAEWSLAVQDRDEHVCAVCGIGVVQKLNPDGTPKLNKRGKPIWVPLHTHHLLPRERYPEFRTVLANGLTLCPLHHKFSKYSFHRNPIWAVIWLRRARPDQYTWCKQRMGSP